MGFFAPVSEVNMTKIKTFTSTFTSNFFTQSIFQLSNLFFDSPLNIIKIIKTIKINYS